MPTSLLMIIFVFSLILAIKSENYENEQNKIFSEENINIPDNVYTVEEKRVPHPSNWRQQGRIRSFYSPTIPNFNGRYSRFSKYGPHRPMFIRYMRSFYT